MSEQINQDSRGFTIPPGELGLPGPADAQPRTAETAAPPAVKDEHAAEAMTPDAAAHFPLTSELRALAGATAWLNSPPLTAADLRGHVVLVQFWTYTCVNWLRTLPYVRAWAEQYRDRGLIVIGAHAPEFPFEHDLENVRQAAKDMGITYPIAQDNDLAIWRGFSNHYWPALYLFDAQGDIRYHHFGEGEYVRSETMIQRLLAEDGKFPSDAVGGDLAAATVTTRGAEVAADWDDVRSPETYLGYDSAENFASPGGAAPDARRAYAAPARLRLNQWALTGEWTIQPQGAVVNAAGGRIVYRFHARDLNLAMGPAERGASVRVRALLDGAPPGASRGDDLDGQGNGTLAEQRLYQLIRQPQPIADRQFEIEFLDAGAVVCVFTFG